MREWQFDQLLTTLSDRVRPAHTAVIVVDMQNDYVSVGRAAALRDGTVADEQAIVAPLQSLLNAARSAGVLVVYLQMTYPRDQRLASEIGATRQVLIESPVQGRTEHFLPVALTGETPGAVLAQAIKGSHDGRLTV